MPSASKLLGLLCLFLIERCSTAYKLPHKPSKAPSPASSSAKGLSRADLLKGIALTTSLGLGAGGSVLAAQEGDVLVRKPALSERIFDTTRRSYFPVERERLQHNKALDNAIICVGEIHTDSGHHHAQYSILRAAHQRRDPRQLAIGMEMFYRSHQPILDEYIFGQGTLAQLKADTKWDRTWGHKLSHYSKILNYAKKHQIRVLGLNVPATVVQVVSRYGLEDTPIELKSRLPEMDLTVLEHRENFMALMKAFGGVHGSITEDSLTRLYQAQTLWDEYMAESASNFVKQNENSRLLVMAGTGHIENRYGIPDRITRRTRSPVFTVVPITVDFDEMGLPDIDAPYGKKYADWIYFIQNTKNNA